MKKLTLILFTTCLMVALAGCHMPNLFKPRAENKVPNRIRLQVFEVPALVLDRFLPPEQRTAIPNSAYVVVQDQGSTASDLLFQGIHADAGLLFDETRALPVKPATEIWNYPTLKGFNPVRGTVAANVGLGDSVGQRELLLDGKSLHLSRGAGDSPSLESRFSYHGPLPQRPLLFIAPFERPEGQKFAQVLLFTFSSQ